MLRNTDERWGWPAKVLHWVGAAAILILLLHGWWMTHLAPRPARIANYAWHAALGYDLVVLLIVRLLWRWTNVVPSLPPGLGPFERFAARISNVVLYLAMVAAALTGWALAGSFRTPLTADLFGLNFPPLGAGQASHEFFEQSHELLAYLLAALAIAHIFSALHHHFVKRNDVLRRML